MDDWKSILQNEFSAAEGSFLLQTRCDLVWDADAFDRLITAMEACCRATVGEETLDRWVADGFWYISWFVENWTTHPNSQSHQSKPKEYYEAAYLYLFNLASWYFDDCPWTDGGTQARAEFRRLHDLTIPTDWKD